MIKKILIFNSPGPDYIKENDYKFNDGEDSSGYYFARGWHQVIASLVEGLISLPHIDVFLDNGYTKEEIKYY